MAEKCSPNGPPSTCCWVQNYRQATERLLERSHREKNNGKTPHGSIVIIYISLVKAGPMGIPGINGVGDIIFPH